MVYGSSIGAQASDPDSTAALERAFQAIGPHLQQLHASLSDGLAERKQADAPAMPSWAAGSGAVALLLAVCLLPLPALVWGALACGTLLAAVLRWRLYQRAAWRWLLACTTPAEARRARQAAIHEASHMLVGHLLGFRILDYYHLYLPPWHRRRRLPPARQHERAMVGAAASAGTGAGHAPPQASTETGGSARLVDAVAGTLFADGGFSRMLAQGTSGSAPFASLADHATMLMAGVAGELLLCSGHGGAREHTGVQQGSGSDQVKPHALPPTSLAGGLGDVAILQVAIDAARPQWSRERRWAFQKRALQRALLMLHRNQPALLRVAKDVARGVPVQQLV
eukprot:jgi/Mesvir1/10532/Mv21770-RA.1